MSTIVVTESARPRINISKVRLALAKGDPHGAARILLEAEDDLIARIFLLQRHGLHEAAMVDIARLESQGNADLPGLQLAKASQSLLSYGEAAVAASAAEHILSSEQIGDDLKCRGLTLRGMAAHRLDRWESALRDLFNALEIADALGDLDQRVDILRALSTVETWRGQQSQALLHLTLAIADSAQTEDRFMISDLLGDCGRLNLEMRRFAYALAFFDRQVEIASAWLEGTAALRLQLGKAQALVGLGRHEEAQPVLALIKNSAGVGYLGAMAVHCSAQSLLQQGKIGGCVDEIESFMSSGVILPGSFEHSSLSLLAAEAALQGGDMSASTRCQEIIEIYQAKNLFVPEIEARQRLALLLAERGAEADAGSILRIALIRSRAAGLALLERSTRETMTKLEVSTIFAEETDKKISIGLHPADDSGYVLLEKCGVGRFATVFRAYDVERDRDVAFKRFTNPRTTEPALWKSIEQSARAELKIAARLVHPGVARVLAIGNEQDGSFYTVQDFIAGHTLRETMKRDREYLLVCQTMLSLSLTLAAMHDAGVVHRDIKPDNIICPVSARPVIIDLGIASISGISGEEIGRGTSGYAAPEQWTGRTTGPPSDIFSLGVVAHEWLFARLPLQTVGTIFGLFGEARRIRKEDRHFLVQKGLEKLAVLLETMILFQAEERPSAQAVANDLVTIIASMHA